MNILTYTTKLFYMTEQLERACRKHRKFKKHSTEILEKKNSLLDIIHMCKYALQLKLGCKLEDISPEIFDEYEFSIKIEKKNKTELIFGGEL